MVTIRYVCMPLYGCTDVEFIDIQCNHVEFY